MTVIKMATACCVVLVQTPGRRPLRLMVGEPIEVGRECDGLMVGDPLASRRHVVLRCVDGVLWATDLGSSNGTWLNGELVEGSNEVAVGSELLVGTTTITVEDG